MFFTKFGRVIAWLMVIGGGSRVVLGLAIAFTDQALAPLFLGTRTTGQAINEGSLYLLIGVAVGMLAEISRSVASKDEVKRFLSAAQNSI